MTKAGQKTYLYQFARIAPGGDNIGAIHASEVSYVFGNRLAWLPRDETDEALSQAMERAVALVLKAVAVEVVYRLAPGFALHASRRRRTLAPMGLSPRPNEEPVVRKWERTADPKGIGYSNGPKLPQARPQLPCGGTSRESAAEPY